LVDAFRFTVAPDEAGGRLDHYLVTKALPFSRSQLRRHIDEGGARVGGEIAKPARKLRAGEQVELTLIPRPPTGIVAEPIALAVLYEDADLIVIDKPAKLVVHPAAGHASGTLVNAIAYHVGGAAALGGSDPPEAAAEPGGEGDDELDEASASPAAGSASGGSASGGQEAVRPGIVHRLDRDTTGVMVVAKTDAALTALAAQFKERTIERRYVALVQGHLAAAQGRWETPYGRDPRDRKKFSSKVPDTSHDGTRAAKRAATQWWVLSARGADAAPVDATLVEAKLETGRTHQLRVHFADHGYPLLGDPVYGRAPRTPTLREVAKTLGRQALHARLLGFIHPRTGVYLEFASPLPQDLRWALEQVRVK
jgi:23S rRNA pseudouridine1911/1915/1917 synthase